MTLPASEGPGRRGTGVGRGATPPGRCHLSSGLGLLATALLFVALGLAATSAHAAFPGQNGKIAFQRYDFGPQNDIWTINPDGSLPFTVTADGSYELDPAVSPDGTRIAFARTNNGGANLAISVANADGSRVNTVTKGDVPDSEPSFSPDGTKLVFVRNDDLYTINLDRSGETNLTNTPDSFEAAPAFSPDGTKIAFDSATAVGDREIYVMSADGSGQANLTVNPALDYHPSFSPDGARIAFGSDRGTVDPDDPKSGIYTMNVDGSDVRQISPDLALLDRDPAFSPDGTKIAFTRKQFQLFTMSADGSGATALTEPFEARPSFSADWGPLPVPPVVSPAAPAAAPQSPVTPPVAPAPPARPAPPASFATANPRVAIAQRTVTATRRGLVRARVTNANDFEVTGVLRLGTVRAPAGARTAGAGRRSVLLGAKPFRIPAMHSAAVRIRLSRRGLKLVRRRGRVRVRAVARVRDPAGHLRTVRAAFTLKARLHA